MRKVDIIVPIYNAYQFTEECIKSVIKHTDLSKHNLLLINDKSPDEKILPMLKKYEQENPEKKIIVLENEENMGFVKSVNKGMSYSENDVILLNSDTEVTKNWLEKMLDCAYQNEYIATVTPLTNNGTIASVPNFGMDNELPANMTLDEYAQMIETCSLNRFPELTTANGFCMFIKRSAIKEIGLFDDETFGKGYGEENDFCYRALNRGYIHLLCDNTFVYHKGTQSFKKENMTKDRLTLVEEHMEKLRKKHEVYVNKTDHYLQVNPAQDVQENIRMNVALYGKKRILFLVNEWEENMEMTGGASLHLKDIIQKMRQKDACFVLSPERQDLSTLNLYLYTENCAKLLYQFKTDINLYGQVVYYNHTYHEIVERLFEIFQFDILHVQHFLFQPFDVINIAKEHGTYAIATLHDLYLLCPSINMVYDGKYCEEIQPENCQKCFVKKHKITENILENWRKNAYETLRKFDQIIVPSENTKNLFLSTYPDLKMDVIEHGIDITEVKLPPKTPKDTFDIAFVGVMARHKGSEIFKELLEKNQNLQLRFHFFGKRLEEKLQETAKKCVNHGSYDRKELPQKLLEHQIDLVCMFSVCPETYSYTLSETFMAKIPVLAYDLGAIADRIKKDKLGWLLNPKATPDEILAKINQIKEDKTDYENIKANFEQYSLKTVHQMQEEYEKIYAQIPRKSSDCIKIENLKHCESEQNKMYEKQLKLEDKKKEKYIQEIEMRNRDFQAEEKRKIAYIKALELVNAQKKQEIEFLKQTLQTQNDTIRYYENMRVMKFIKNFKKKGT